MVQKLDRHESDASRKAEGALARRFAWVFGALAVVLAAFVIWAGRDWRMALSMADRAGKIPTEAYVKWGMWWAGLVNACLCALLALTSKWWAGKRLETSGLPVAGITKRDLMWLVVVLMAAGGLRWARMDLSFYNDEAHTFRTYVAGRFRQSDDGQIAWKQLKWLDTFWFDKVGNNLMPCSVFGRLSYDAWGKMTHAPDGAVCETAVRFPQWVAGMMALVVLWLASRRMLGVEAAWVALVLMALHPWAVRYSTEARAYGMLMLGITLCFYFLQRAFEDGRWRWWLGLGLAEFLCVWSFTGVVFYLVVFNAAMMTGMIYKWRTGGEGAAVLRPIVGLMAGGMLALQLMLPTLPQLTEAMKLNSLTGTMGQVWWMDALGGLLWGTRGWDSDPANPFNLALERMLSHQPVMWFALAMEVGLLVMGFFVFVKRGGAGRILALAGPVAVVAGWAIMASRGKYLHPWYVIYALPWLIICITFGLIELKKYFYAKYIKNIALVGMIFILALSWVQTDVLYARHGKENVRGIAETAHGFEHGMLAPMLSDVDIYDHEVLPLKSAGELDEIVARATQKGVPLIVSVGHESIGDSALVLKRLRESGEFEPVATLWGLDEAQFTHYIFKLRQNR